MKKAYQAPTVEKLEFNYTDTIVASGSIEVGHTDMGIGVGHGGGCDHIPEHGNPHKPHPHFPNGKP